MRKTLKKEEVLNIVAYGHVCASVKSTAKSMKCAESDTYNMPVIHEIFILLNKCHISINGFNCKIMNTMIKKIKNED